MKYAVDEDKLRGAILRGARRGRILTATSGTAFALALLICLGTIGAAVSPAFAEQLRKLPVIGSVLKVFRPGTGIIESYKRGVGEALDMYERNDYVELRLDWLLPSDEGFVLAYRYRWLKRPSRVNPIEVSALNDDGQPLPYSGDWTQSSSDTEGWYIDVLSKRGNFKDVLPLRFRWGGEVPDIEITLPYDATDLPTRTVALNRQEGQYALSHMTIAPNEACLYYELPSRPGSELMYVVDAQGGVYYSKLAYCPLSEQGIWQREMSFDSPYYAPEPLTLWILRTGSTASTPIQYTIVLDDQGNVHSSDGIELVDAIVVEGGCRVKVRLSNLASNARGLLHSDDQGVRAIRSNEQVFEYLLQRTDDSQGELTLTAETWSASAQIEIPLE